MVFRRLAIRLSAAWNFFKRVYPLAVVRLVGHSVVKLRYQIGTADTTKFSLYIPPFFGFIPEEELPLGKFFLRALGAEHGFKRIGVIASIPCFGAHGHGGGGEVLHLLKMEVEPFGGNGKFCHIFFCAAWMATDKVGDDLFAQLLLFVNLVKDALELLKLTERRFAHQVEHLVAGVFRSNLETAAYMMADEFARVLTSRSVGFLVFTLVEEQVVAHTTAYETLLDAGQSVDGMIDVEQLAHVGVEVGAYLGMDARRTRTLFASLMVAPMHAVHVGRGSAKVAQIALEIGHLCDEFHFFEDALLAPAHDEFALMGTDSTKGTASETSAVDVDRKLDHLVGRDALVLVFGVGQPGVGQIVGGVEFFGGHRRIGRIDHGILPVDFLNQSVSVDAVGLFLDMTEIVGLCLLVLHTFCVAMEYNVVVGDATGDFIFD